jgi:hypothetical protein
MENLYPNPQLREGLKQYADEIMGFEGKTKGLALTQEIEYIRHKEGEEGVKKIESIMADIGYPLTYKEVQPYDWYKEGYSPLMYRITVDIFGWTKDDIFEIGKGAMNASYLTRFVLKFVSVEQAFEKAKEIYNEHLDFSELKTVELKENDSGGSIIVQILDYPDSMAEYTSKFLEGFCVQLLTILLQPKTLESEVVIGCEAEGAKYCQEYRFNWTL